VISYLFGLAINELTFALEYNISKYTENFALVANFLKWAYIYN
jgi:hypothetical protein